jgi:hypothetical protein
MGTSRSASTPSGGGWSQVKSAITSHFSGHRSMSPKQLARDVVEAGNGFGVGRGGSGGGGGGGGMTGGVGRAVAGLGGFGGSVAGTGLDDGLRRLGLDELIGRSAAEVVSAIATHLTEKVDGVDAEVLRNALTDAILEAATLDQEADYTALEDGLQTFLAENGPAGLVETFLCHYVFDMIWINIEGYVQSRSSDENSFEAFMTAIEGVCRAEVRAAVQTTREQGTFDRLDWFGNDGRRVGREIVADLEGRFRNLQ